MTDLTQETKLRIDGVIAESMIKLAKECGKTFENETEIQIKLADILKESL